MKKTIAAVVMSAVAAVGSANAAIVFGNLGSTGADGIQPTAGNGVSSSSWTAVGFTTASPNIYFNSATIGFQGTGDIKLSLYSSVGVGAAANPLAEVASTTQSVANPTAGKVTFSFLNPISFTLAPSTSYWLVASAVTGSGTWVANGAFSDSSAQNSSGWSLIGARSSVSSGSVWADNSFAEQGSLSIDATAAPIPEPGTWAAMAILAGGAAFAGWRRRQQQPA